MTVTSRRIPRLLFAVALLTLPARGAFAAEEEVFVSTPFFEEKSLLAPDGTLYVVRAGTAINLGLVGNGINPSDYPIEWTLRRQDGTVGVGLVPDTADSNVKRNLDLAYDEASGSLVLLWKEELSVLSLLHLGIFRNDVWTQPDLLPNPGFAHTYDPQMLLSRLNVRTQDADGKTVTQTHSILSVIWWEEGQYAQARYAPIFLDGDISSSDVQAYDLPATIGGSGASSFGSRSPSSYMYPALQLEGPAGAILASFADLNAGKHYVVRITFPDDLGKPGPSNVTWLRRRIPVVGVASEGPIGDVPVMQAAVTTIIGPSYKPTFVWRDDNAVAYMRFDGKRWSSVKTIPLSDRMPYDRALRLVEGMASKN